MDDQSRLPCIIAIGGCTCSGKTTLCSLIEERMSHLRCHSLHLDDFYFLNVADDQWEEPSSLDFDSFFEKIETHRRSGLFDLLLIEGFLIFHDVRIRRIADISIFLFVDREESRHRRSLRDPFVLANPLYFEQMIWPKYLQHNQFILSELEAEIAAVSTKTSSDQLYHLVTLPSLFGERPVAVLSGRKDFSGFVDQIGDRFEKLNLRPVSCVLLSDIVAL